MPMICVIFPVYHYVMPDMYCVIVSLPVCHICG